MRKLIYGILAIVLVAGMLLAACGGEKEPTQTTTLRLVSAWGPQMEDIYARQQAVIDAVNSRSDGELVIELLGGPEIVSPYELHHYVADGVVELGMSGISYYSAEWPEGEIVTAIKDEALRTWFRQNMQDAFDASLQDRLNLKWLGFNEFPVPAYLFTTVPVRGTDWSGLTIRAAGPQPGDFAQRMGAATAQVPSADVIIALQQGIIDGELRTPNGAYSMKEYEYVHYTTEPYLFPMPCGFFMNMDAWNALPAHLQDLLMDVFTDLEPQAYDAAEATRTSNLDEMEAQHGLEVYHFSAQEEAQLNQVIHDEWDQYLKPRFKAEFASEFESICASQFRWA